MSRTSEPTKKIREIVVWKEIGRIDLLGKLKIHDIDFNNIQSIYETYTDRKDKVIKIAINICND